MDEIGPTSFQGVFTLAIAFSKDIWSSLDPFFRYPLAGTRHDTKALSVLDRWYERERLSIGMSTT
jgi:hypothetical protein